MTAAGPASIEDLRSGTAATAASAAAAAGAAAAGARGDESAGGCAGAFDMGGAENERWLAHKIMRHITLVVGVLASNAPENVRLVELHAALRAKVSLGEDVVTGALKAGVSEPPTAMDEMNDSYEPSDWYETAPNAAFNPREYQAWSVETTRSIAMSLTTGVRTALLKKDAAALFEQRVPLLEELGARELFETFDEDGRAWLADKAAELGKLLLAFGITMSPTKGIQKLTACVKEIIMSSAAVYAGPSGVIDENAIQQLMQPMNLMMALAKKFAMIQDVLNSFTAEEREDIQNAIGGGSGDASAVTEMLLPGLAAQLSGGGVGGGGMEMLASMIGGISGTGGTGGGSGMGGLGALAGMLGGGGGGAAGGFGGLGALAGMLGGGGEGAGGGASSVGGLSGLAGMLSGLGGLGGLQGQAADGSGFDPRESMLGSQAAPGDAITGTDSCTQMLLSPMASQHMPGLLVDATYTHEPAHALPRIDDVD